MSSDESDAENFLSADEGSDTENMDSKLGDKSRSNLSHSQAERVEMHYNSASSTTEDTQIVVRLEPRIDLPLHISENVLEDSKVKTNDLEGSLDLLADWSNEIIAENISERNIENSRINNGCKAISEHVAEDRTVTKASKSSSDTDAISDQVLCPKEISLGPEKSDFVDEFISVSLPLPKEQKQDVKSAQADAFVQQPDNRENTAIIDDSTAIQDEPIKKPIKESKIGLKKPREKLGERLGNKKLGSRITKPLVGIGSESCSELLKSTNSESPSISKMSENRSKNSDQEDENLNTDEQIIHSSQIHDETSTSSSNWGSWGDWGLTLATAASTLTREMSRGVGSVMETVEGSIGAPAPEELAKETVEMERKLKDLQADEADCIESKSETVHEPADCDQHSKPSFAFGFGSISGLGTLGSLVSGMSNVIESAGSTVLHGGLDTLEKIGRKTMDVIQDGDPGLRRKRTFLQSKSPNLSMVLRAARQRALEEEENKTISLSGEPLPHKVFSRNIAIGLLWDSAEGSAHLEALSLISKQCQMKTENLMKELPAVRLNRLQPIIGKIKACCELDDDDDQDCKNVSKELQRITRDVQLPLQFAKMLTEWPSLEDSIKKLSIQVQGFGSDEEELADVQRELYKEVALLVSHVVGVIHKAAELSLITPDLICLTLAQQFREICSCISFGLEKAADDICESITRCLPTTELFVSDSVTNIYVQMAEANSYLQTALQYFTTVVIQVQAKQIAAQL